MGPAGSLAAYGMPVVAAAGSGWPGWPLQLAARDDVPSALIVSAAVHATTVKLGKKITARRQEEDGDDGAEPGLEAPSWVSGRRGPVSVSGIGKLACCLPARRVAAGRSLPDSPWLNRDVVGVCARPLPPACPCPWPAGDLEALEDANNGHPALAGR